MRLKLFFAALFVSLGMMAANTKTTRATQISSAVTVSANTDYVLTRTTGLFSGSGTLNIPSTAMEHSVIIFQSIKPSVVISTWLKYIRINGATAVDGTNCQVKMYNKGAIVLPYASGFQALTCYTGANFTGSSYSGYTTGSNGGYMKTLTTAELKNNFKSFKLKRGYMVTFATGESGYGYSRCFVADTEDLEMDLPTVLSGKVSSYRLFSWYNFGKSGIANNTDAATCDALNVQACYTYNVGGNRLPDVEWLSHQIQPYWPGVAACGQNEYSCTMKTDNEPANANDDNPASVAQVLGYWEDAMRTGMRLCSPSTYDGSNNKAWFDDFFAAIDARGWRCDLYDIHCYWTNFGGLSTHYGYYNRPLIVSEWMWGASWNSNGSFGSGVTDATIKTNVSSILNTLNTTKYVERYFYWNSESKAHIYENGALTSLGETYAATDGGLGYNRSYEYVPKVVISNPYSLTGTISGSNIVFTWKDHNGDMMDEIRIQYKKPSATSWTTLTTVARKDKTNSGDQSYSYTGTFNNAGDYEWRVVDAYEGTEYASNTLTIATGGSEDATVLPANVNDFYFQFYSKEASSDLVWAVTASGEDRVQYKAKASDPSTDLYQLWILEPNSNGGYSLRNLGEAGYLIASPAAWNFVTRNSNYTVEAPQTAFAFEYNTSGGYWVCKNLYHSGNYVGLWDNDKNFAAGEVLAGNRDSEAAADHLGIRMILRSELSGGGNTEAGEEATVGDSYYIYNVDAGKFLTSGNSYGTHASLGASGLRWTLLQPASGYYSLLSEGNGYLYATDQDGLWVDGSESLGVNTTGGDLTSTYLTNANFSGSTATTSTVYGYGKDGTPYGYQDVTSWTKNVVNGDNGNASYPNSGMVGAVFSYGSAYKMQGGGHAAPSAGPNGETGNCLGILGVWGCGGYYYQSVTLPAGSYTLTYKVYNQSGTAAVDKSYFGFIANSGTEYLTTQKTFTAGSWLNVTVSFTLTASTAGKICVGYKSAGSGSGANPHLFVDNVTLLTSVSTTITHDTQSSRFFTMSQASDGTYTFQVDPTNPHLGTSAMGGARYVGFVGDIGNTPYVLTAPKESYHSGVGSKWLFMSQKAYNIYRMTIIEAAAYRQQMWPLVISARAAGVGSEEIAVYEDPTSTASQIVAAMSSLKEKILAVTASEASPVDYSFFITNGDCASSTFEGWTTEGSWGSNTTFYHNGDALLTNRFSESWVAGGGTLDNRSMTQTLSDLPAGKYQLSLDVVATQQNDASVEVTGATLFLGDQSVGCHSANGVPETFTTPTFTVNQGTPVSLGFKLESTTANWVAFDNFRLRYLGAAAMPGDVNNDGTVTIADVTALVNLILGKDGDYNQAAADVNADGSITIADVTALVNKILGKN